MIVADNRFLGLDGVTAEPYITKYGSVIFPVKLSAIEKLQLVLA
jgi:hypothetical protein